MALQTSEAAKLLPQEDEDRIQRKRIVMLNRQFKNLATTFARFSREVDSGNVQRSEDYLKGLFKELINLEHSAKKMDAVKGANKRDQEGYRQKKAEQEVAIVQAQKDIEVRKQELEEARVVRQHNEEYEKLRHSVMQHPQRSATILERQQLEADILALQAESARLDITADRRRKQFALLLHCIEDLQANLASEDEAGGESSSDATPGHAEAMEVS